MNSNRNGRLDALRGVAILLVLGVHFKSYPTGHGLIAFIAAIWRQVGPVGVILFFVLSGFLIGSLLLTEMQKHSNVNIARFLIRRGFKLYPVYYLFIAYHILMPTLKAIFAREHPSSVFSSSVSQFIPSFVFLQNYIAPNPEVHTWSLAVEEHFYLVLPFVISFLGFKRVWNWLIPICFISIPVCASLRAMSFLHQQANSHISLACQMDLKASHLVVDALMLGVALATTAVKFQNQFTKLGRFPRTLVLFGLILWVIPLLPLFSEFVFAVFEPTLWLIGSAAIFVGVCSLKDAGSGNRRGILAWVGANSYAIYVWHLTIIGIVEKYFNRAILAAHVSNDGMRWILTAVMTTAFCVLAGVIVTKIIETPALALRDKLFPSRGHAITLPDKEMSQHERLELISALR